MTGKKAKAFYKWIQATHIKASGKIAKNMEEAYINSVTKIIMMESLLMVCDLVKAYISGLMAVTTMVSGKLIK